MRDKISKQIIINEKKKYKISFGKVKKKKPVQMKTRNIC